MCRVEEVGIERMGIERNGNDRLLDVLEHVAEGGIVVIGDAKFEASGAEGEGPPARDASASDSPVPPEQ